MLLMCCGILGALTEQLRKEFNAKYCDAAVKDLFLEPTTPNQPLECVYFTVKDIPHELLNFLYVMGNKYHNDLFDICWRKQCNLYTNLTFEEMYPKVCKPVLDEFEEILLSLQQKTITLENVDKYFQKFEHASDMEDNLKKLCQSVQEYFPGTQVSRAKHWVHGVVKRIQEYKRINSYMSIAVIVLNLKESLKLRGDFTVIERLAGQVHSSSVFHYMINVVVFKVHVNCNMSTSDLTDMCVHPKSQG